MPTDINDTLHGFDVLRGWQVEAVESPNEEDDYEAHEVLICRRGLRRRRFVLYGTELGMWIKYQDVCG